MLTFRLCHPAAF